MSAIDAFVDIAEGSNPGEIASLSGLPLTNVERILDFLVRYGLVRVQGSRIVLDDALLSLPPT